MGFSFVAPGNAAGAYTLADGVTAGTWTLPDGPTVASLTSAVNTTGATRAAERTTLVSSPIASACFSCHDSDLAKAHMQSNDGSIYEARSTALAKTEQCALCHLAGKVADIKAVHAK